MPTYEETGRAIGAMVDIKNIAYGDSFKQADKILMLLFPDGVAPDKYQDILFIARVIDKLFRIATDKTAFGENPAQDIAGYSILKCHQQVHNDNASG